tara:strand:- start:33 stop:395 length:363 start_codon:yes stop_codon:yes gene_type:complete
MDTYKSWNPDGEKEDKRHPSDIRQDIIENLQQCFDPEISINIYDLGLIYDINLSELPKVAITHTLTSAFCPAADQIVADIKNAAEMVEGVDSCFIETTFDPPFGPEMMSEEAKLALGIFE